LFIRDWVFGGVPGVGFAAGATGRRRGSNTAGLVLAPLAQ
jgi:hypothetical protein